MKIIDEDLLDQLRSQPLCDLCGKTSRWPLQPHHILSRGQGGWGRCDVPENLVAACRLCHLKVHRAEITKDECFQAAGKRIGKTPEECAARVIALRNAPKT